MKLNTTVSFLALVAPVLAASIGSQEVLLTLTHVSGDTTSALDSNCFSAVDHAVKNAFQTVHKNSDFSIAGLEFTTEVDAANYDDDDAATNKATLRKPVSATIRIGGRIDFGCTLCDHQDTNLIPGIALREDSPVNIIFLHRQFEIQTRKELKQSGCAAFKSLREVDIAYVANTNVSPNEHQEPTPTADTAILTDDTTATQTMFFHIDNLDTDKMTAAAMVFANDQVIISYNNVLSGGEYTAILLDSTTLVAQFTPVPQNSVAVVGIGYYSTAYARLAGKLNSACNLCLEPGVNWRARNPSRFTSTQSLAKSNELQMTHREFELELAAALKSSSFAAFAHITDVKVRFDEDTNALAKKNPKPKPKPTNTLYSGPLSVEMLKVDFDRMNGTCVDILSKAIVDEYNKILSAVSNFQLVETSFNSEVFIRSDNAISIDGSNMVEDVDSHPPLGKSRPDYPPPLTPGWRKPNLALSGWRSYKCLTTKSDCKFSDYEAALVSADLLNESLHETFEDNVYLQLRSGNCAAFSEVSGLNILFGKGNPVAIEQ